MEEEKIIESAMLRVKYRGYNPKTPMPTRDFAKMTFGDIFAGKEELAEEIYQARIKQWFMSIIFTHDFALRFWLTRRITGHVLPMPNMMRGESAVSQHVVMKEISMPEWQYQLQRMVIDPDPIRFISKFI